MKKRVNISIGPNLHQEATAYADQRESDFSSLVAEALRAFMAANPSAPVVLPVTPAPDESYAVSKPDPEKQFPTRNSVCACGSGLKYKRCCEKVTGSTASKLACPTGFKRLERHPRKKELCPCGSGYQWGVCCKSHLPFVEIRNVS